MARRLMALATFLAWANVLAACAGPSPAPSQFSATTPAMVASALNQQSAKHQSFSAEMRVTYFDTNGRLKGTASLAARRPGKFRYNLLGPHGGVLEAFATNGTTFELSKMSESRFLYGPATPTALDQLLPFAPLHLGPKGWVELLFGTIDIPPTATMVHEESTGLLILRFQRAARQVSVHVDPSTMHMRRLQVAQGENLLCDVTIEHRHSSGLPSHLELNAPGQKVQATLKMRDIQTNPTFGESVFQLSPPRGVTPEYLGPVGELPPKL